MTDTDFVVEDNDNETIYRRPRFWQKGHRVKTADETLKIKIGITDSDLSNNRKRKKWKRGANRVKSTKYTLITFLPLNLFEQFRRIANFYFLIMTIIALVIDSPVSPLTSLIPLVFVISVTAAKQGYENYLRYKADSMVNKALVTVYRNGIEEEIKCEDIQPGDIVKIPRDCDVPCDLVLLKSSDASRKCFITTANLDGETNLKTILVPKGLPDLDIDKLDSIGDIECEQSKTDLYSFNGRIDLSTSSFGTSEAETDDQIKLVGIPLMAENVMLRGSRVKNTEWGIGCAIYTGAYTKLALNSKLTRNKLTSSEKFINKYLIFFLVLLIVVVTTSYLLKYHLDKSRSEKHIYLFIPKLDNSNRVYYFFQDFFSFLVLFNYIIPISLYVTIELHKFIGSLFMEWDIHLYDEETNQPCIVNTSDLNEELGQVNILFSDKTGTLTKNEMIFKQCSINGKKYLQNGRFLQEVGKFDNFRLGQMEKPVYTFFEALAVCHTVQVAGKYNDDMDNDEETEGESRESSAAIPQIFSIEIRANSIAEVEENDEVDVIANELPSPGIPRRQHNRSFSMTQSILMNHIEPINPRPFGIMVNNKVRPAEFNRAISEIHPTIKNIEPLGHRRSKSSGGFPEKKRTRSSSSVRLRRNSSTRSSSREYYAAPSFTTASLLERNESMLGIQIKTFIDQLDYQASSPDEKALVESCAKLGIVYLNDNNEILKLKIRLKQGRNRTADDQIVHFKRLAVLEFTSDRKRMSVIVMDQHGQIWIYTKGAESHVFPLCRNRSGHFVNKVQGHINDFAREGLRTLAVARRKISRTEYINFNNEITEANNSLSNRAEKVEECQRKIETGLELLGATAVEDALQDNVKDTLISLRRAGIKIWVLTGDKVETALNIAYSCGHMTDDAKKYFITECTEEVQIQEHLETFNGELQSNPDSQFALLIDGSSLAIALKNLSTEFRDAAIKCHAVLCCRLSPLQKCEIVHLMKSLKDNLVTASIGDGANDVSMIQEAHVGLGIVGKEGRQAARSSDYAFAKFCMLKRILLVHGHYFSQRLSLLILYFFYKNLVFMGIQLYFQISSLFSSQSIYDSLFLTLYNVVYTALPILFISLTEKVHSEEKLTSTPEMYKKISKNKLFAWRYFFLWMFLAVYHSGIIYSFGLLIFVNNSTILGNGKSASLFCFGTTMIHNVVMVVNLKLLLETVFKTYLFIGTILLSMGGFILTTFIYNLFIFNTGTMFNVYNTLMSALTFWALSLLVIVTCLVPDLVIKALQLLDINFSSIIPKKFVTRKERKKGEPEPEPEGVQSTTL